MKKRVNTRLNRSLEPRLVAEWVVQTFPHGTPMYRVPLGPPPDQLRQEIGLDAALQKWRPWRPEVDAVVIEKDRLTLVEGKIFKVLDGIAKLIVYRALVPYTPELQPYANLPLRSVMVTPKPPYYEKIIADAFGMEVVIYRPEWVLQTVEEYNKRWTAEGRLETQRRKDFLKTVGFT